MFKNNKFLFLSAIFLAILIFPTLFFNKEMFLAFIFLFLLLNITFIIFKKYHVVNRKLAIILCASFLLHFSLIIFIHHFDIKLFGGGADYESYQVFAEQISEKFSMGQFVLEDELRYGHDFPVVLAIPQTIFGHDPLVWQSLIAWLFMLSVLFAYLTVLEMRGSEKMAFYISLFINLYPSYAYFGSLTLKDTLIIPFALFGILLSIKIINNFSWDKFIFLFLSIITLSYFRFYIGYALIFSFIISWFFFYGFKQRKKTSLGFLLVLIIGFAPLLAGQGYFGYNTFKKFLTTENITFYREISYNPDSDYNKNPESESISDLTPKLIQEPAVKVEETKVEEPTSQEPISGTSSSFVVETGLKGGILSFIFNSFKSLLYALFGPFAWQLKYKRQMVSLIETIPWYALIIIFMYSVLGFVRNNGLSKLVEFFRKTAPLWTFSILAFSALALFINNYGIIVRIKIPMIICLVIMMSLLIKKENLYAKRIINHSV